MAFTGKQQRNGTDESAPVHDFAPADHTMWPEIAGRQAQAESVGAYRYGQQAQSEIFVTPFGTGVSGGMFMNPGGSMWEWDGGLAVSEMPGEWSQQGVTASTSPVNNTPSNVVGLANDGRTSYTDVG